MFEKSGARLIKADKEWLDGVNAERKKEQAAQVSYELFEIIMDKLEKEWFNLVRIAMQRTARGNIS